MADTLIPWSGNAGNPVTDSQFEDLARTQRDAVLYGQAGNALQVSVTASGAWTVQAGKSMIAGHVYTLGAAAVGQLAGASAATRYDLAVVYLNRTTSPWTWGIRIHAGTSGGGVPAPTVSPTGLQEFQLGVFQVLTSGAVSLFQDSRRYQTLEIVRDGPVSTINGALSWDSVANVLYSGTGTASVKVYEDTGWVNCAAGNTGTYWSTPAGQTPSVRRLSGTVFLRGAQTRQTGAYPKGVAGGSILNVVVPAGFRPDGQWSDGVWVDSGAGWLLVNTDGTLNLGAVENDMPVGYSVHLGCSWPVG